jgi:hypothetical protein
MSRSYSRLSTTLQVVGDVAAGVGGGPLLGAVAQ